MVARVPSVQPDPRGPTRSQHLPREVAIEAFRRVDAALVEAAARTIAEKERIASQSGIHVDELERLIGNETSVETVEVSSRAVAARQRRAEVSALRLPDGYEFPPAPLSMSRHPAVQRAFRVGVAASFDGASECPYDTRGLGSACGSAWRRGLDAGRALQRAKGGS